jgi:hypothetical protein
MKKILLFMMIVLLAGCSNTSKVKEKIDYIDDSDKIIKEPTYKFTGESEHFVFQTGEVEYNENKEQALLIKNFKLTSKMNDVEKYYLIITFNDVPLLTNEYILLNNNFEEEVKKIEFAERGVPEIKDGMPVGENDSFILTKKEDFKNSIKIGINYCYHNNNCKEEYFNINYITD